MKAVLVFPPQAQPFLPHPAVPGLVAVLRRAGHEAWGRDLNLEAYRHFLSPAVLEQMGMPPHQAADVERAATQVRCGTETVDRIAYHDGIRILRQCLAHVSRQYEGLAWDLKSCSLRSYSPSSWQDVGRATSDRKANPFVDWFEQRVEGLLEAGPDLLGISVAWCDQVIPAFTLARVVKERAPGVHVCMGGSMITHLADVLQREPGPHAWVDSFLPGEGEQGIVALLQALQGGDLGTVPGLIHADGDGVRATPPADPVDLATLPVPAYEDLDLAGYYSPRVLLPVSASRGCYWGRCTFCSHHLGGSGFRRRSAEDVLAEMDALHRRHGCVDFYFSDDSLPPALCAAIADGIAARARPYRWAGELRLEPPMDRAWFERLHRGGARLLLFGLESASERVLGSMAKGLRRDTASAVLQAASEAGIITWVFFFLGFPGETRAEAEETLEFLVENRVHVDVVAGGGFALVRHSPVDRDPAAFGIRPLPNPEHDLALVLAHERLDGSRCDVAGLLEAFRRRPPAHKFAEPFVAEPHLLFFSKDYFRDKARRT